LIEWYILTGRIKTSEKTPSDFDGVYFIF